MKNKIAKLMGVVLTAVTVLSLFAFALPASAAITPQTWTKQAMPGATGYVMPQNDISGTAFTILASGPVVQDSAGNLFTYVQTTQTAAFAILKSTNGGRSWALSSGTTGTGQPTAAVTALVAFGTNIYYAQSNKLFRSTDNGLNFINICNTPDATVISTMDVGTWSGRDIIVLGTTSNVFSIDSADPFFTVAPLGTPDFATTIGGNVLAVKVSTSFGTDRGVAAISTTGVMSYDVLGGAWGAIIGSAPTVGAITAASIHFTSDWNATTLPNFYFATSNGIYAFRGVLAAPSTTLQLYSTSTSTSSTGSFSSLDVTGLYGAATIYGGIVNSSTQATQLVYSSNAGATWTAPKKLQAKIGAKVFVLLDNSFATNSTVYTLVGGAGLAASDDSGFYYSVDKGASNNEISLINDYVTTINDINASNGITFISTSNSAGFPPTASVTAGKFVVTAGSYQTLLAAAVAPDVLTITKAAAGVATVLIGPNLGASYTIAAVSGCTVTGNTINFTGAGSATVTALVNLDNFSVSAAIIAGTVSVSATTNSPDPLLASSVGGASPIWNVILGTAGTAATYNAAVTNTVATITPTPAPADITVVFSPAGGTYAAGVITFTAPGQTATVTNSAGSTGANWASSTVAATYGTGATTYTVPQFNLNGAGNSGWGGSGSSTPAFTLLKAVAATTGAFHDSIWRWDGTNFERVLLAPSTILPNTITGYTVTWAAGTIVPTATMVRVSSKFATDNTVFYAAPGGIVLTYSADKGQTWTAQTSNVGASDLIVNQIGSLLVVDGTTQYVGVTSAAAAVGSRVIKTASNGAGTVLSPAWTEVVLKNLAAATLTGNVTEISVAANGDLLAVVTDAAVYVFKSTDAGLTWKGLADPNFTAATDATIALTPSMAWVDQAADGSIFVTANSNGVTYRYSSLAAAVTAPATNVSPAAVNGWLKVNNAGYSSAAATTTASGQVITLGGPGSTAEGSGMVYTAGNASAGYGVSRIRGITTQAEYLVAPTTAGSFTGVWASSSAVGNVQLWTIDNGSTVKALYTYVDTLNVAGTGVTIPVATLGSTTAAVNFNALTNATGYTAFVSTAAQLNLYSAATDAGIVVTGPVMSTDGKTGTFTVTGLTTNTAYSVSIWANAPVSSFIFTGSFTTNPMVPVAPIGLVPDPGSQNVMTLPTFQWNPVLGATSYELWLDTKPGLTVAAGLNTATATKYTGIATNAFAVPAALANNTVYYWQVRAVTSTGYSAWSGTWSFTTVLTVIPPVTVTSNPVPTIILTATSNPVPTIVISNPPVVTVTQAAAAPAITVTQPSYTLVTPTAETPSYIWIIVGVGALLTLAVIILIIRTRRVV